jgi:geranylgeranyl reductase family protein
MTAGRGARAHDVIVVGGGPAGSTLAWRLARDGVRVLLLERTRFPREKVCGDYVEPRGLRILQRMGCLRRIEERAPLPITHSATFVGWEQRYADRIPFYGLDETLPPHGYIVPRDELDEAMLEAAERAGATVHEETLVTAVDTGSNGVAVEARRGGKRIRYRGRLIAGADGANSVVGTSAGVLVDDPRHTAVAQRAYATGVDGELGEAAFFFDEELFPGYGWMFPLAGGRVNIGVGILSETRRRLDLNVPALFVDFVERLKRFHPRCARLELCSPPIGGIVRTYGGAGPNHFDGGVLVGDAGSFVDPMTGEGIAPAAESALLAAPVLEAALDADRSDAAQLRAYERGFRAYFDPAMMFLDFCAAVLRNRNLARPWLKALARGCDLAGGDEDFARTGGSYFGGLDVRPFGILAQLWARIASDLALAWPRLVLGLGRARDVRATSVADLVEWQLAWSRSLVADPLWHARWSMDVQRKSIRLMSMLQRTAGPDPRAAGLVDG